MPEALPSRVSQADGQRIMPVMGGLKGPDSEAWLGIQSTVNQE